MSQKNAYQSFAYYSSIIFMLPACLLVGYFLGDQLDQWLDTGPVLTFVFFLLGAAAGFVQLFRMLKARN